MNTSEGIAQEDETLSFDMTACMALMEKKMGEHEKRCGCADLMSQFTSQEGVLEEWLKVMPQLMEVHRGC